MRQITPGAVEALESRLRSCGNSPVSVRGTSEPDVYYAEFFETRTPEDIARMNAVGIQAVRDSRGSPHQPIYVLVWNPPIIVRFDDSSAQVPEDRIRRIIADEMDEGFK